MKLRLTLFLILLPFMSPIHRFSSSRSWVWNWDKKLVLPEEQHPAETESQTSSWLCRFGLSACPTEIEDENNNQVLPQEQILVDTKSQTSNWLCWFGLTTCPGNGDNKLVLPEERLPINTEAHASNWPFRLGLSPYLK